MIEKVQLRKKLKREQQAYADHDFTTDDQASCTALLLSQPYREAERIFAFHPLAGEVDIHPVLAQSIASQRLYLPIAEKDGTLSFYQVADLEVLVVGRFSIYEPLRGEQATPTQADLMLIPALAYSRDHSRLGRGGGYYDRYLAGNGSAWRIGLCRAHQLLDTLPNEMWDQKVDQVLCDGVFY
jgi:5-formyltetrahydrofolate cyclo-ligase